MAPEVRRAVAMVAARLISGRSAGTIYDFAQLSHFHISGSVGSSISLYDHDARAHITGSPSQFFHHSENCHVQLNVSGKNFTGFDFGTSSHFTGSVSGSNVDCSRLIGIAYFSVPDGVVALPDVMHLYLDDTGTRHPDHNPGRRAAHGYDWFGPWRRMIKQEDEVLARTAHAEFMQRWGLDPDIVFLHSAEIRHQSENFTWLGGLSAGEKARFHGDLSDLMIRPPVLGFACVIDRPGYNYRYRERYGRDSWSLCRTAFSVLVERAAKYANAHGHKLKVFVEKADRVTDGWMKGTTSISARMVCPLTRKIWRSTVP
jgi:hypothetical protein